MKHALRLMLALTVATMALPAPVAHAQIPTSPQIPTTFTIPTGFHFVNSRYFYYFDDDGWGYMAVQFLPQAALNTALPAVLVFLTRNGRLVSGTGISFGNYLFFSIPTVANGFADAEFFQGQFNGWGSHFRGGNPTLQGPFFLQPGPEPTGG
jgi:hypothetical protein